jgi:hypothetical protein
MSPAGAGLERSGGLGFGLKKTLALKARKKSPYHDETAVYLPIRAQFASPPFFRAFSANRLFESNT